jgi:hypothetical protein
VSTTFIRTFVLIIQERIHSLTVERVRCPGARDESLLYRCGWQMLHSSDKVEWLHISLPSPEQLTIYIGAWTTMSLLLCHGGRVMLDMRPIEASLHQPASKQTNNA